MRRAKNPFLRIGGLRPGRSIFNLSYSKLFDCYSGQLIPIMCDEMVPGDTFILGNDIICRLGAQVAPTLHEINIYCHYFFVPYRLLWTSWEEYITGGKDGTDTSTLPRWEPTTYTKWSLWDYLGFPIGIDPDGHYPMKFPMNAYNLIYNEYYRDQNLITEVSLDQETILKRAWEKDYFTASLPWQQRGTTPALPISGTIDIDGKDANIVVKNTTDATAGNLRTTTASDVEVSNTPSGSAAMRWITPSLEVDLGSAVTFDVEDLRLAFQIQKFMERNARAGVRYKEFLAAHFGITLRDERAQRPEYCGGSKNPIIISEVLQTSATGLTGGSTSQGNLAGHGITAGSNFIGKYTAPEFGLMMGILSIMPRTQYSQGINRQWMRETRYDFYFPEFAHLSEQAVLRGELYASGTSSENNTIFGYVGAYDEMRIKYNQAVGSMAYNQSLNYWTLSREFGSAPALNQTFVEHDGSSTANKRIFATTASPQYIVHVGNRIKAIRPLPIEGNPGLIDHA